MTDQAALSAAILKALVDSRADPIDLRRDAIMAAIEPVIYDGDPEYRVESVYGISFPVMPHDECQRWVADHPTTLYVMTRHTSAWERGE